MRLTLRVVAAVSAVIFSVPLARADIILTNGRYTFRNVQPAIVAGAPSPFVPPDSPAMRVDPNVGASAFTGVVSLALTSTFGSGLCSGAMFSPTHVLTAAHCLDFNDDGAIDVFAATAIYNITGALSDSRAAASFSVHPAWTGFGNPSINDDIAVITLAAPAPAGATIYGLYPLPIAAGTKLTHVGYGTSGDGVGGFSVGASFSVKRSGMNNADVFFADDDGSSGGADEIYAFDFDSPDLRLFPADCGIGGATLGNLIETTLGPGDSGGPAFIDIGGTLFLAGNDTFGASCAAGFPFFGSAAGGMLLYPYLPYVTSFLEPEQPRPVPEPSSITLLGLGAFGLLGYRWRSRKSAA